MQIFHGIDQAEGLRGCALCLGNFDGVHVGHQALFGVAARHGHAVAVTFDPHPGKVLGTQGGPSLITPLARKLELLEEVGLWATVVQPFTRAYAQNSARSFEEALLDKLGAAHLVVGADFTYGHERQGTVETLARAAATRAAHLHVVPPVTLDGLTVSSSRIRKCILEGSVQSACRLLGRPFDLDGEVVKGEGRGRELGFPTANLDTRNELRPAPGVYAVRACLRPPPGQPSQPWLPGAANIGIKPTFGGSTLTIEAHLLDFSGDLYGKSLRLQFIERLRPEQRFSSLLELKGQIGRDLHAARTALAHFSG